MGYTGPLGVIPGSKIWLVRVFKSMESKKMDLEQKKISETMIFCRSVQNGPKCTQNGPKTGPGPPTLGPKWSLEAQNRFHAIREPPKPQKNGPCSYIWTHFWPFWSHIGPKKLFCRLWAVTKPSQAAVELRTKEPK